MKKAEFSKKFKCPVCGGIEFKQEIMEIYFRRINNRGEITEYEDDFTHDIKLGPIRCIKCENDCSELFNDVEIE